MVEVLEFITHCLHPIGIAISSYTLEGSRKKKNKLRVTNFLNVLLVVAPLDNLPRTLSMDMEDFLEEARMQRGT
jgi:hypothetical protein